MIEFNYKNHRGEVSARRVKPISLDFMPAPNPNYGYPPGWFLTAADYTGDRQGVVRSFFLYNIQLPTELFIAPRNDHAFRLFVEE